MLLGHSSDEHYAITDKGTNNNKTIDKVLVMPLLLLTMAIGNFELKFRLKTTIYRCTSCYCICLVELVAHSALVLSDDAH